MKWVGYLVVAASSSALTTMMYSGGHFVGPARHLAPPTVELAYSDFLAIVLTAVTVVLGALAIAIGIIAFKTVKEIKVEAADVAKNHSNSTIAEHMKTVPEQVNTEVDKIVRTRLPEIMQTEIVREIEVYARDGRLAKIIEKAQMRRSFFSPEADEELQEGFDNRNEDGGSHG